MLLKHMLISYQIPLEESVLALALLLDYAGVSVLVDKQKNCVLVQLLIYREVIFILSPVPH